jgi:hypothetical protein
LDHINHYAGQDLVNLAHVFGETVQDATRWVCVEKEHGSVRNTNEHFVV